MAGVIAVIVNQILEQKNMTKYKLAKLAKVPQTTIIDICSGKTKIDKCAAGTIYKLAKALDTSMEHLLSAEIEERPAFEIFKSNVCHRVKEMGDLNFIFSVLKNDDIRKFYNKQWYPESLYLLAMIDFLSRENNIPLCTKYNDLRNARLQETVYPLGVYVMCIATGNEQAKDEGLADAIPEFMRHNIMESEVRNVC